LFRHVIEDLRSADACYLGLRLRELCQFAAGVAEGRNIRTVTPGTRVAVVFDFALRPD